MTARLDITLDCHQPEPLAEFWAAALDYENAGRHGEFWPLFPRDDARPIIVLQQVDEPRTGKNRMHLDLHVDDLDGEVARLVALGARRLSATPVEGHGHTWVVMADPEGNEFCVVQAPGPG